MSTDRPTNRPTNRPPNDRSISCPSPCLLFHYFEYDPVVKRKRKEKQRRRRRRRKKVPNYTGDNAKIMVTKQTFRQKKNFKKENDEKIK